MRQRRKAKILLALFFIAIPNINIVDLLPDFIAYIILYRMISAEALAVPHMHEAKCTLRRLILVTLMKIPMFVIMVANMYSGRDIVTLFTLVFCVIEAILLYSLVTDVFAGLFYIAGRTDADAITSPLQLKDMTFSAEGIRLLTITFLMTKCSLNVLPEFCLLTTFNPKIIRLTNGLYAPLLLLCFIASLVFGIMWFGIARKYIKRIKKSTDLASSIKTMLGDERLEKIKNDLYIDTLTRPVSLLAISSIFIMDFSFIGKNGINLLPHFIYGIFVYLAIKGMSQNSVLKKLSTIFAALYGIFGTFAFALTVGFVNKYRYLDLIESAPAREYYAAIKVFTLLETLSFILLAGLAAYIFRRHITENTGVSPKRKHYNKIERDYHRMNSRRGYILFAIAIIIHIAKCVKVFLDGNVNLIFSNTGLIVTSPLPWFGWMILAASVGLMFYSFIFLSGIKEDIRFKYDKEETDTRRGIYE